MPRSIKKNINSSTKDEPFNLLKMCTPATIYFVVSVVVMVLVGVQNLNQNDSLCIGDYSCYVGSNTLVFIVNGIYILFWSFVLDLFCKNGYKTLSWIILLLPFLLVFLLLFTVMIKKN